MSAALVDSIEGMDVLLCEKSQQVGGTASTSAGTLWIPGNTLSRDAGFSDTREAAQLYLDALISPHAQPRVNLEHEGPFASARFYALC